jgi:hypothetical protein
MKVCVLNDTFKGKATTGGGHFGCELVMRTLYRKLKDGGHEVVQSIGSDQHSFAINPEADLVIVNGEGSIHHNKRRELIDVAKIAPSILINAVWQESSTAGLEHFKYISVRESSSLQAIGGKVDIVPDLIFASAFGYSDEMVRKSLVITDSVFSQNEEGCLSAIAEVQDVVDSLCSAERVATGRFHIAAMCAMLDVPFTAWPSNTHKIEGMMFDMGCLDNFYCSKERAVAATPKPCSTISSYVEGAVRDIDRLFKRLPEWA